MKYLKYDLSQSLGRKPYFVDPDMQHLNFICGQQLRKRLTGKASGNQICLHTV